MTDLAKALAQAVVTPESAGRTYELGGPTVMTFRQVLELVLAQTERRRLLLPLPFPLASALGALMAPIALFTPLKPPLTSDQVELLKRDNVPTSGAAGLRELGVTPTPVEAITPTYLYRFRRGGQFADMMGQPVG